MHCIRSDSDILKTLEDTNIKGTNNNVGGIVGRVDSQLGIMSTNNARGVTY